MFVVNALCADALTIMPAFLKQKQVNSDALCLLSYRLCVSKQVLVIDHKVKIAF